MVALSSFWFAFLTLFLALIPLILVFKWRCSCQEEAEEEEEFSAEVHHMANSCSRASTISSERFVILGNEYLITKCLYWRIRIEKERLVFRNFDINRVWPRPSHYGYFQTE